jgi:hypothetical protein
VLLPSIDPARPHLAVWRTPRRIWARSIDSKRARKFAFAETLVALALDNLEEDRADYCLGEDLQ